MKRMNQRPYALFISLVLLSILVASCGGQSSGGQSPTSQPSGSQPTTAANTEAVVQGSGIAFIYKEKSADYNWSHLQELGRQYLMKALPDVSTNYVEDVGVDKIEQTLRDLAPKNKLIFATAPEYSDAVLKVAPDFPNTKFEVARGTQTAANVATYDGRMYQAFYVAGGYAGDETTSNIVGVIAPEKSPEVMRDINALALSTILVRTRQSNSIHVIFTNSSWSDPDAERQAALKLIAGGADVLVQIAYDPEVQKVAEENKVRSFGYGYDMRDSAPTQNMTSIVWNWGWYFVQRVNALNDGSWKGEAYNGETSEKNFGEGVIDLAPYTYDQIPQIFEAPPMKWRARFFETNKDVFDGPISNQAGEVVVARGKTLDADALANMDWFVKGVVDDTAGAATPEATETAETASTPEMTAAAEATSAPKATAIAEVTSAPEMAATPEVTATPEATATAEVRAAA